MKAFKSKVEAACYLYFQELLKVETVQDKLELLGCPEDLNNKDERDHIAQCMANSAPVYLMDHLDDIFEDIYCDILVSVTQAKELQTKEEKQLWSKTIVNGVEGFSITTHTNGDK